MPLNRWLVAVTVSGVDWASAEEVDAASLVGWDAGPPGKASLDWGGDRVSSGRSLLARVPSVVVPEELDVLVDPAHPRIAGVKAAKVRRWLSDVRLKSSGVTRAGAGRTAAPADCRQVTHAGVWRRRA